MVAAAILLPTLPLLGLEEPVRKKVLRLDYQAEIMCQLSMMTMMTIFLMHETNLIKKNCLNCYDGLSCHLDYFCISTCSFRVLCRGGPLCPLASNMKRTCDIMDETVMF